MGRDFFSSAYNNLHVLKSVLHKVFSVSLCTLSCFVSVCSLMASEQQLFVEFDAWFSLNNLKGTFYPDGFSVLFAKVCYWWSNNGDWAALLLMAQHTWDWSLVLPNQNAQEILWIPHHYLPLPEIGVWVMQWRCATPSMALDLIIEETVLSS